MIAILKQQNEELLPEHYFYQRLEEHAFTFKEMASNQKLMQDVMRLAEDICDIVQKKGQLFLCGNGGSAADAQHIATEFV